MNPKVKDALESLVPLEVWSQQPVRWQEVLYGWEQYFTRAKIAPDDQLEEFDSIIRARAFACGVSVVSPLEEQNHG